MEMQSKMSPVVEEEWAAPVQVTLVALAVPSQDRTQLQWGRSGQREEGDPHGMALWAMAEHPPTAWGVP